MVNYEEIDSEVEKFDEYLAVRSRLPQKTESYQISMEKQNGLPMGDNMKSRTRQKPIANLPPIDSFHYKFNTPTHLAKYLGATWFLAGAMGTFWAATLDANRRYDNLLPKKSPTRLFWAWARPVTLSIGLTGTALFGVHYLYEKQFHKKSIIWPAFAGAATFLAVVPKLAHRVSKFLWVAPLFGVVSYGIDFIWGRDMKMRHLMNKHYDFKVDNMRFQPFYEDRPPEHKRSKVVYLPFLYEKTPYEGADYIDDF